MDKKIKILIKTLYILIAVLIVNIICLISTINRPHKTEYYNENNITVVDYKDLLSKERINTLSKITDLNYINWGYYDFSKKSINGGYISTYDNTPTIIISPSLKNKSKKRQSTLLHEFSHYLLNEHKDAPPLYQTLNTKEKETITDITAYTLDDYFFGGQTFKGNYIPKRKIKKYKEFQKEIENFINLIKKEIEND